MRKKKKKVRYEDGPESYQLFPFKFTQKGTTTTTTTPSSLLNTKQSLKNIISTLSELFKVFNPSIKFVCLQKNIHQQNKQTKKKIKVERGSISNNKK